VFKQLLQLCRIAFLLGINFSIMFVSGNYFIKYLIEYFRVCLK